MDKGEKKKDVKATQYWENFQKFASILMQITPEEVKQVDSDTGDTRKDVLRKKENL